MAKKWYRNKLEASGDPRGEILIGGAGPGEAFEFDYDQPGYNVQALLDQGAIEEISEPNKAELVERAEAAGIEGAAKMSKDELVAALAAGEGEEQ